MSMRFSFIVPAYNEESTVSLLAERLVATGEKLAEPFEILFINDGSTDNTASVLDRMAQADARIRVLHFSRNFGQMAALTAGIDQARADGAVICLDADGQHPPELIPGMVERWRGGADIVQAIRKSTHGEGAVKRATSKAFYALMNWLSDTELKPGAADFRLLDAEVVTALRHLPERERFVRGLVSWVGFRTSYIEFTAPARIDGATKYTFLKMFALAASGIASFSVRPLRLSLLLAFILVVLAGAYGAFALFAYAAGMPISAGWTSLVLVVILLSSVQLACVGILSEYMARVMTEVKQRPIYLIRNGSPSRKPPRDPGQ
jgi:glycosyltransferase involved in cell wall biosynthesis